MLSKGNDVTTNKNVKNSKALRRPKVRIFIAVLISLAMILSMTAACYAVTIKTVYVSLDGQVLKHAALESEEILFLPLRTVCEALGCTVEWNPEDWSVTARNEVKTVVFEPKKYTVTDDRHSYYVNGMYPDFGYIGGGCIVVSGRTYIDAGIIESCFGLKRNKNQAANTCELSTLPHDNMTAENVKITYEDDRLTSTVQYPKIGMVNKAAADKINAVILTEVQASEKEMQDSLKEAQGYQSPNKFAAYFNYEIPYRQGSILSLVFTDYQYFGGAHGDDEKMSHTFNMETGTEYTLRDLMKDKSGYLEYINESIKAAIIERGLAETQLTEFVSIAGDQDYYLTNNGLVVYFQRYEYFPGAAGIQEFEFPYTDLAQYIKPEFAL